MHPATKDFFDRMVKDYRPSGDILGLSPQEVANKIADKTFGNPNFLAKAQRPHVMKLIEQDLRSGAANDLIAAWLGYV